MGHQVVRIATFLIHLYLCGAAMTTATGGTLARFRRQTTKYRIVGGVEAEKHEFPWMALGGNSIEKC